MWPQAPYASSRGLHGHVYPVPSHKWVTKTGSVFAKEPCGFHLTRLPQGTDPSCDAPPHTQTAGAVQPGSCLEIHAGLAVFPNSRPPGAKEAASAQRGV